MIANGLVQQIKGAAQIESIIGDYIVLKRFGANYKALCPFHDENTFSNAVLASSAVKSPAMKIVACPGTNSFAWQVLSESTESFSTVSIDPFVGRP